MIQGKWEGTIRIPEGKSNDYVIKHIKRKGNVDAFNLRTTLYGQPRITVPFDGESTWHEMSYDGGVWMTDLPIEQQQHDREMECMEGAERVLVGGLGLSYALHKLVRDYDVQRIDVVEISQDVINLVWPHVAPDVKAHCVLHHADLFDYIKEHSACCQWDYGFYDIWQSDGETTFHDMVVPLRNLSHDCCDHVVCWNEDVMRSQLLQNVVSRHRMSVIYKQAMENVSDDLARQTRESLSSLGFGKQEEFLTTSTDKYHKWATPFWRAYFEGRISDERFTDAAVWFVQRYGMFSEKMFSVMWREQIAAGTFA